MAQTDTVVVGAIKTQIVCVHECALGQSVLSFDYSVGVFLVLHSGGLYPAVGMFLNKHTQQAIGNASSC